MDDAIFIAKLCSASLLPGNLKAEIKSLKTSADKADYFIDMVIFPYDNTNLYKLLKVMEESQYDVVKNLAAEIKHAIGMFTILLTIICLICTFPSMIISKKNGTTKLQQIYKQLDKHTDTYIHFHLFTIWPVVSLYHCSHPKLFQTNKQTKKALQNYVKLTFPIFHHSISSFIVMFPSMIISKKGLQHTDAYIHHLFTILHYITFSYFK